MTGSNVVVRDEWKQVHRHDLKLFRHVHAATEQDGGDERESKQTSGKKEKIMGIRNGR